MTKKGNFLILGLVCCFCLLVENTFSQGKPDNSEVSEFVIKKTKKKKTCSKSKLQKEACQEFANQMSCIPQIHKNLADTQQMLLEQTIKYIESEKDGVLVKNKRDNLDEIVKKSRAFGEKMEQFCKECEQYVNYLRGLE